MNIADYLLIFVAGFASVFTLGFQSRVVNAGNFKLAALMSFTVAMFQTHLWVIIASGGGTIASSVVYGLSGAAAITSAMWCHQRFFADSKKSG